MGHFNTNFTLSLVVNVLYFIIKFLQSIFDIAVAVTLSIICLWWQEYIIGRERESVLLQVLLCKHVADN